MLKNKSTDTQPNLITLVNSHQVNENEIDLFDILQQLMADRKLILCTIGICIAIGVVLTFFLPQKWTSEAVVITPERKALITLQKPLSLLNSLNIGIKYSTSDVYNLFLENIDSLTLRVAFLAQSTVVKSLKTQYSVGYFDQQATIDRLAKSFHVQNSQRLKVKDDSLAYPSWYISFSYPNPRVSQLILEEYLAFINDTVDRQIIDEINNAIQLSIYTEQERLKLERSNLETEHQVKLERLSYSLQLANAAGIKKPVYANSMNVKDDPDYSVALGTDGISQKLAIEKSLIVPEQMNAGLQNRERYLAQLKQVNITNLHFQTYKFQMKPSLPLKKDSPNSSLILGLMALVGLIISSGFVLIRNVSRQRQASFGTVANMNTGKAPVS
jgi:LPS O-antigen subunit length determinant protein (WzzB/FepE family)